MPILKPRKAPLESQIEKKFIDLCTAGGFRTRKMNGLGFRDWPDRLILGPNRFFCWVELKRPGEVPTAKQELMHDMLVSLDNLVIVSDSAEEAIGAVITNYAIWDGLA